MKIFSALSIGSLIDLLGFKGVVTGVFDQTFNIQLLDRSLVTCASSSYFNMPRGIRIGSTENCQFKSYVRVGTPAHYRGGIVRFSKSDLPGIILPPTISHLAPTSGYFSTFLRKNKYLPSGFLSNTFTPTCNSIESLFSIFIELN